MRWQRALFPTMTAVLLACSTASAAAQVPVPLDLLARVPAADPPPASEALRRQLIEAIPGAPTFGVAMGAYLGAGLGGLVGALVGGGLTASDGEDGYLYGFIYGFPVGSMIGAPTGAWLLAGDDRDYGRAWQGSLAGSLLGIGVGAVTQDVGAGMLVAFFGQVVGAAFAVD